MSKNYSFRFESILNLKDKVEESKKNEFGLAVRKLDLEKNNLNLLKDQRQEMIESFNIKSKNITTVQEYRNLSNNLQILDKNINKQKSIIMRHESEVDKCKVALINAKRETKIFQKIKENDLIDFKYMESKHEEMLIDHFVSFKSSKK